MFMIRERSIVVMSKTTLNTVQQTSERREPRRTVLLHDLVGIETYAMKDVDMIDQVRRNQALGRTKRALQHRRFHVVRHVLMVPLIDRQQRTCRADLACPRLRPSRPALQSYTHVQATFTPQFATNVQSTVIYHKTTHEQRSHIIIVHVHTTYTIHEKYIQMSDV